MLVPHSPGETHACVQDLQDPNPSVTDVPVSASQEEFSEPTSIGVRSPQKTCISCLPPASFFTFGKVTPSPHFCQRRQISVVRPNPILHFAPFLSTPFEEMRPEPLLTFHLSFVQT